MSTAELIAEALALAATGLPVFPCARSKKPAIAKAQGGRGFHDAVTDPATVRGLFSHPGAALVGVPTGARSGFDVLDLDYRNGAGSWEQANLYRLPETRTHETKSGGRHLLFLHAPGVRNSAGKNALAPGVDVRGEGGYIIMPPSAGYTVIADAEPVHWPDWLLPLVLPPPRPTASPSPAAANRTPASSERVERFIRAALDRVRRAGEGQKHFVLRNTGLLLGGIQDQAGFSTTEAVRWLLDALPSTVRDRRAAAITAAWGLENGRNQPITLEERNPSDPRRKETAGVAFRLLRMGVASGELLAALREHNRRRLNPLPEPVLADTAIWAARRLKDAPHAR